MRHKILFSSILQSENKSIEKYLIHLKSGVQESNFTCPNCDHDLPSEYIEDIQGIDNDMLQVNMLAKAESLKTLEQNMLAKAGSLKTLEQNLFLRQGH